MTAEVRFTRRHKYNAKRVTVDGVTFHSKREAARFQELKLLEKAGEIANLRVQPEFPLEVNGVRLGVYRADFEYSLVPNFLGGRVIEDVKGVRTAVYRLKKKLVEAQYGIMIQEI